MINDYTHDFENELKGILLWWMDHILMNNEKVIGRIDGQGKTYPNADLGIVMISRIMWTFSAAARLLDNKIYRKTAEQVYTKIQKDFLDKEYQGYFWKVNTSGGLVDSKKQIYAQAFVLYATTEFYLLTKDQETLDLAMDIFRLIEHKSKDNKKQGYWEALSRDWRKMDDVRLSDKDANEVKTMNTHLHLLEAFTNLVRCTDNPEVKSALKEIVFLYLNRFIDSESGRLKLFFDEDWNEHITHESFGHEIESAWLLNEAAEVLNEKPLKKLVKSVTQKIAERVLKEGCNKNGGIFNERLPNGTYQELYDWWPQAEAVVGFYDAFQVTGNRFFLEASEKTWHFIKAYLIDHENGEWFWAVDAQYQPVITEDKAGPWKAPYHNGRMCMEMIRRLGNLQEGSLHLP